MGIPPSPKEYELVASFSAEADVAEWQASIF
jgi:hypothetical protein